jgi:hypothetical protein
LNLFIVPSNVREKSATTHLPDLLLLYHVNVRAIVAFFIFSVAELQDSLIRIRVRPRRYGYDFLHRTLVQCYLFRLYAAVGGEGEKVSILLITQSMRNSACVTEKRTDFPPGELP